jgi:predicted methyltransferase
MLRRSFTFCAASALMALAAGSATLAADAVPAYVKAAVDDAARPDADKQRDANRKPAEIVAWAGIKPGDKVADIMPGGGYFTRIFSKVVGPKGIVYALAPARPANAPANMPDMAAGVRKIAEDPQFSNVRVGDMNAGPPEKVDVAWTSLNYHDFHNRPNADLAAFNKQVFDSLKPGGTYIVIDHAAAKGAGTSTTQSLHRIDEDVVKKEVTAAGFKLAGESKILANPQDDHTTPNRDDSVRGHTDQFALKFTKPK